MIRVLNVLLDPQSTVVDRTGFNTDKYESALKFIEDDLTEHLDADTINGILSQNGYTKVVIFDDNVDADKTLHLKDNPDLPESFIDFVDYDGDTTLNSLRESYSEFNELDDNRDYYISLIILDNGSSGVYLIYPASCID